MQQPPGFVNTNSTLVCKFKKVIYGSKKAPRAWYEKNIKPYFTLASPSANMIIYSLYYKHYDITLYALIYINDIPLADTSFKLTHDLIIKLHDKFALKKLGIPKYFLEIEVHYQSNDSIGLQLKLFNILH